LFIFKVLAICLLDFVDVFCDSSNIMNFVILCCVVKHLAAVSRQ